MKKKLQYFAPPTGRQFISNGCIPISPDGWKDEWKDFKIAITNFLFYTKDVMEDIHSATEITSGGSKELRTHFEKKGLPIKIKGNSLHIDLQRLSPRVDIQQEEDHLNNAFKQLLSANKNSLIAIRDALMTMVETNQYDSVITIDNQPQKLEIVKEIEEAAGLHEHKSGKSGTLRVVHRYGLATALNVVSSALEIQS